ncbi:MAG: hypothetical protein NXI22_09910 [bacterium]|nr:hypothetical protein [bacterium]
MPKEKPINSQLRLRPDIHERLKNAADGAGISMAKLIEAILDANTQHIKTPNPTRPTLLEVSGPTLVWYQLDFSGRRHRYGDELGF